jgi:hypothetical protein
MIAEFAHPDAVLSRPMPTLDEAKAIPLFGDLAPHELERVAREAAAVGEGSMAIAFVHQFLANDAGAA